MGKGILITGGSGIALGLPENFRRQGQLALASAAPVQLGGRAVVISGSCSTATRAQVAAYAALAPARMVTAEQVLEAGLTPQEVAAWVALAVGNADMIARTADDLAGMREAMASRAVIEQAKGILIERHKLTEDQAFTALSRASQHTNIKLRDVADELVHTGALPERPGKPR